MTTSPTHANTSTGYNPDLPKKIGKTKAPEIRINNSNNPDTIGIKAFDKP